MPESEMWKNVVGFDGRYQVSNKGNVRSVARKDSIGRKRRGLTLKLEHHTSGYLYVNLYKNGVKKRKRVHRLVSEAFITNPKKYSEVNHLDEVKTNNNVENLEWCTREYNNNYGTRIEKLSKKIRAVDIKTGEVITFSSIAEAVSKGYHKVSEACRGVYKSPNGNLIGGDGRTYKGHKWSYE